MVTWECLTTCSCSGKLIHNTVPGMTRTYVAKDARQFHTQHAPSTSALLTCHLLQGQKESCSRSCHCVDTSQLEPCSSEVQWGTTDISVQCPARHSLAKVYKRGWGKALNGHVEDSLCSSKTPDETCFQKHFKTSCISPAFGYPHVSPDKGWAARSCLPASAH